MSWRAPWAFAVDGGERFLEAETASLGSDRAQSLHWSRWATAFAIALVRLYQVALSPLLGRNCRFAPSCSEYARQALGKYGLKRGVGLAARRILRCHPWHPGGWDPVP